MKRDSMSNFTPGPWEVKGVKGCFYRVENAEGNCVAEVIQNEADARLIAAAREMVLCETLGGTARLLVANGDTFIGGAVIHNDDLIIFISL